MILTFTVPGIAVPQGSKTHTRYATFDDNAENLKPWRDSVTYAARDAQGERPRMEGPIRVYARFEFVRPKSVSATKRPHMTVKPDLDKLLRAVFDACPAAGVWRDDAQVVALEEGTGKFYAQRPQLTAYLTEI